VTPADLPAAERCPTCDREGCGYHERRDEPWCLTKSRAHDDCDAHRVDWRARALAAEPAAARWAKVAPLIERLRHTRRNTKPGLVVEAIDALLAATEATP